MEIAAYIYPKSIRLDQTNTNRFSSTFLDLDVRIDNDGSSGGSSEESYGRLKFEIYDKRKDFGFEVLKLPQKDSNLPSSISKNVITAQLIRAARICSSNESLAKGTVDLILSMIRNGHDRVFIINACIRAFQIHKSVFIRYGILSRKEFSIFLLRTMAKVERLIGRSSTDEANLQLPF